MTTTTAAISRNIESALAEAEGITRHGDLDALGSVREDLRAARLLAEDAGLHALADDVAEVEVIYDDTYSLRSVFDDLLPALRALARARA